MEIIHLTYGKSIPKLKPFVLAIGFFDGLHLGHLSLVRKANNYANEKNVASALMTFEPNPLITLGKMKEEHYLTSYQDRAEILEKEAIDYLIIVEFSKEVSQLSPEEFYNAFIQTFSIKGLVCGFDYHFGKMGKGSGKDFEELSHHQFPIFIQDEVQFQNQKISSTRIHQDLVEGKVEEVHTLLTRPYRIKGEVIKGRQIGRTIGFPTANVAYGSYAIPKNGVYGVKVKIKDQEYIGMCNIGYNPTFDKLDHPSLEVNIFDFNEDIYNQIVEVYFYFFVRDEVKFASPTALVEQLKKDRQTIKDYFEKN